MMQLELMVLMVLVIVTQIFGGLVLTLEVTNVIDVETSPVNVRSYKTNGLLETTANQINIYLKKCRFFFE